METVQAAAAIIGLINGFRLLQEKSYWGFLFFVLALLFGILLGVFHWFGIATAQDGFLIGLQSSGFYRVSEKISGNP